MASVASGGTTERSTARILFKVLRVGSDTRARYSSTFLGADLRPILEPRLGESARRVGRVFLPIFALTYHFDRHAVDVPSAARHRIFRQSKLAALPAR